MIIKCNHCGHYNKKNRLFCKVCGSALGAIYLENNITVLLYMLRVFLVIIPFIASLINGTRIFIYGYLLFLLSFLVTKNRRRRVIKLFFKKESYLEEKERLLTYKTRITKNYNSVIHQNVELKNNLVQIVECVNIKIIDYEIGLMLKEINEDTFDNNFIVSKALSARRYYLKNKDIVSKLIGQQEYDKRILLFNQLINQLQIFRLESKSKKISQETIEIIDRMLDESDLILAFEELCN